MTDGLVPQQRTDRTGRTQTRWVKPQSAPSSRTRIPAPAAAAAPDVSPVAALVQLLVEVGPPAPRKETRRGQRKRDDSTALSGIAEQEIAAVHERVAAMAPLAQRIVAEGVRSMGLQRNHFEDHPDQAAARLAYYVDLAPVVAAFSESDTDIRGATKALEHATSMVVTEHHIPFHRALDADKRPVLRGAAAHLLLTGEAPHGGPADWAWLGDHLDLMEQYAPVLRGRGGIDREFLEGLADSSATSLADGYL